MWFCEIYFDEIIFWGIIGALVFGTAIYLYLTIGRHARLRRKAFDDMSEYKNLPLSLKHAYTNLLNKRYGYIQKYLIFLAVSKISGFASVLFSVLSLTAPLLDTSEKITFLYGFISIICVIIALYLSPAKRIKEYIVSWRMCDAKVFDVECRLQTFDRLPNADKHVKGVVKSIAKVMQNAESNLTSEEE